MLNKSGCRRGKPQLTQQRQKPATTLHCWYSCVTLAVPEQKAGGKNPSSISFSQPIHLGRRTVTENCSLSSGHGEGEKSTTVSQTHFGIIIFSFVFFLSFYQLVSMRGKVEKYSFFPIYSCQMFYACNLRFRQSRSC